MTDPRRVLTIGHSYCVRRNRELAEAMHAAGGNAWSITIAAPDRFPGDLGAISTRRDGGERAGLSLLRLPPWRLHTIRPVFCDMA